MSKKIKDEDGNEYELEDDIGDFEDDAVEEEKDAEISEADVAKEKEKIKALGLEKMSQSSFGHLYDEETKSKRKQQQQTKKPFRGFN